MTTVLISLVAVAFIVISLRSYTSLRLCPVCAGVVVTWAWLLALVTLRPELYEVYRLPLAILMGASVAGSMRALEGRIGLSVTQSAAWKVVFVTAGVGAVHAIASRAAFTEITLWLGAVVLVAGIGLLSGRSGAERATEVTESKVARIKKEMEECC